MLLQSAMLTTRKSKFGNTKIIYLPGNPMPHKNMPSVQNAKLLRKSSVALEISGQSRIVAFDVSVSLSESIVARIQMVILFKHMNCVTSDICLHEGTHQVMLGINQYQLTTQKSYQLHMDKQVVHFSHISIRRSNFFSLSVLEYNDTQYNRLSI